MIATLLVRTSSTPLTRVDRPARVKCRRVIQPGDACTLTEGLPVKYRTLKAPLAVQVEITDNCNERCSHCYRSCQLATITNTVLSPEGARTIVRKVAEAGVFTIAFTGGEPLLYPKSVIAGIEEARANNLEANVNTNLQALTEPVIECFTRNNVKVLTSLASKDAELHERIVNLKGSFPRLMRNMKRLIDAGVKVSANMVVRKDNYQQVYETGMFAFNLGVQRFSATKAAPTNGIPYETYAPTGEQIKSSLDDLLRIHRETGKTVDILESYPMCFLKDLDKYRMFARRNCTAGVYNCSISPNGNVRPCSHATVSYGNALTGDFVEAWKGMEDWRRAEYLNEICRSCPYVFECSGGCREDAKVLYGDICGKDPLMGHYSEILPQQEEVIEEGRFDGWYSIQEWVHSRSEDFGGSIKANEDILLLGEGGWEVFNGLKGKVFRKDDIVNQFGATEEDAIDFVSLLSKKGALRHEVM